MSKFPYKTSHALREYFENLPLNKLMELKLSYAPHFEQLDKEKAMIADSIQKKSNELSRVENRITIHEQALAEVETAQSIYEQNLSNIRDERADIDRVMGLRSLGISPIDSYNSTKLHLLRLQIEINSEIDRLNRRLSELQDKTLKAVSELSILTDVIEKKTAVQESNVSPNYAFN
ncbi:hypothetical protein [Legionella waltersii]|uniref:Uncharacterized protein n=1 Tax=Legionella waltersii TaxID=66969 RepID=A0A0W1AAT8_9GAMM|nr:hypothetical protein [Legionella waltersii]KTD78474.1 hypothetical protein Lwal_1909 [Legionella waltersii]SNV05863.1 Uncharacterised protein [Legionella waltersii]